MTFQQFLNWDRDTALAIAPHLTALHPNWITTFSLYFAIAGLAVLYWVDSWFGTFGGACLVFLSRWLDWIDGYVARATNRTSTIGGLYDIAVGYVTMVLIMVVIGLRQNDALLAFMGAGLAIALRLILMTIGWALSRRQRLSVIPWNPQKLLMVRQPNIMNRIKAFLDAGRNDYWIVVFAIAGSSGMQIWAWGYSLIVALLIVWLVFALIRFLRRVPAGAPMRHSSY